MKIVIITNRLFAAIWKQTTQFQDKHAKQKQIAQMSNAFDLWKLKVKYEYKITWITTWILIVEPILILIFVFLASIPSSIFSWFYKSTRREHNSSTYRDMPTLAKVIQPVKYVGRVADIYITCIRDSTVLY